MIDRDSIIKYALNAKEKSYSFWEADEETRPMEFSTRQLLILGTMLKDLSKKSEDYELLGIGQSLIEKCEELDSPYSNVIHAPE